MDIEAAVVQIEGWAESDWIGLWEITAYVGDEMGEPDSEERQLELIVSIVKGLRNQDPDAITASIRREWQRNKEFPSWGDGPWFTLARLCSLDA